MIPDDLTAGSNQKQIIRFLLKFRPEFNIKNSEANDFI